MAKLERYPPPPLTPWSHLWRYAVACAGLPVPLLLWAFSSSPARTGTEAPIIRSTGELVLDLVLALVCLVLVWFRRTRPLLVGVLVMIAGFWSIASMGAALLVLVSVATRRRWAEILVLAGVNLGVSVVIMAVQGPPVPGAAGAGLRWLFVPLAFQALFLAVVIFVGMYIGARRDLLASLRERAETAEREQVLRVQQARVGERARIAREMHDVMAHRVSLVAMHADALAFREDLDAGQMREAATVIQQNAHLALTELRGVLGALRQDEDSAAPPQPTLAAVDALIAEARESGQRIDARIGVDPAAVPERISRDAFRVLQEALTNARKHAPGAKVTVRLTQGDPPDAGLRILVSNPFHVGGGNVPGSRAGLIGVRERVEMAEGTLDAGRREDVFVLDAWLPTTDKTAGAPL